MLTSSNACHTGFAAGERRRLIVCSSHSNSRRRLRQWHAARAPLAGGCGGGPAGHTGRRLDGPNNRLEKLGPKWVHSFVAGRSLKRSGQLLWGVAHDWWKSRTLMNVPLLRSIPTHAVNRGLPISSAKAAIPCGNRNSNIPKLPGVAHATLSALGALAYRVGRPVSQPLYSAFTKAACASFQSTRGSPISRSLSLTAKVREGVSMSTTASNNQRLRNDLSCRGGHAASSGSLWMRWNVIVEPSLSSRSAITLAFGEYCWASNVAAATA